ncbi:MAG TPA: DUF2760 domain-containing protein [Candidatus Binatia bacterium]|nr:DUF2760 domain-containing protein [Candidatus Binatia bacterium]
MSETRSGRAASVALAAALLLVLAVANALAVAKLTAPDVAPALADGLERIRGGDFVGAAGAAWGAGALPWLAIVVLGPLVVAVVLALAGGPRVAADAADRSAPRSSAEVGDGRRARPRAATQAKDERPAPPVVAAPSPAPALRLLAALQEDARLLDFVREDIAGYSDDQVGSAVRGIHAALRKAIDSRMALEPILSGDDGDPIEVPAGFDPASIRVTGSPSGPPPYRGVLRHGGWRARDPRLPMPTEGSDPTILMPAEVEVG